MQISGSLHKSCATNCMYGNAKKMLTLKEEFTNFKFLETKQCSEEIRIYTQIYDLPVGNI